MNHTFLLLLHSNTAVDIREQPNLLGHKMECQWRELAAVFGAGHCISTIQGMYLGDQQLCLMEIMCRWMKNNPTSTWNEMADIVHSVTPTCKFNIPQVQSKFCSC